MTEKRWGRWVLEDKGNTLRLPFGRINDEGATLRKDIYVDLKKVRSNPSLWVPIELAYVAKRRGITARDYAALKEALQELVKTEVAP